MISGEIKLPEVRFERKYLSVDLTREQVEYIIRNHPLGFSEIYSQRQVNNIYFDTLGMNNYYDNIDGNTFRRKFRIRWYGGLFGPITKPVLEIKMKEGGVGSKGSFPLLPFVLDKDFNRNTLQAALMDTTMPVSLKNELLSMHPVLLNTYTRNYYLSFNKVFRATLDHGLTYYKIGYPVNTFLNKTVDLHSVVLELKYLSRDDEAARNALDFSPLAITKSSKYVQGFESVF